MHNNYYFLRQLSRTLEKILVGAVVSECYSQSKGELILRFETQEGSFYIRTSTLPIISCLSFPSNFQRARKNSVDLFNELIGRHVVGIRQFNNERAFALLLKDGFSILFKMHGNRSNVIVFENETPAYLFRSSLQADQSISLSALDRPIDWTFEAFQAHVQNLPSLYFTFGKVVWDYLRQSGFTEKLLEEKWRMIQRVKNMLEEPSYYVVTEDKGVKLSLLPFHEIKNNDSDPIAAANNFYYAFVQTSAIAQEKNTVLSALRSKLSSAQSFILKNQEKLNELSHNSNYKEWADLIMANMHAIPAGAGTVTLSNFYNGDLPIEIKLKTSLTPQKNAEAFYRKSKNQQIEIDRLRSAVETKENESVSLKQKIEETEALEDLKLLRKAKAAFPGQKVSEKESVAPFHEFEFKGFRILVGKNAVNNDLLTFRHGHKEDLWLHAKDVAGSHVLIKYRSGKNFPKDVIERAAELAAYNSKRKTDTLCPVIVTPKKFVRKRKGDPAGAVIVEREEIVMVQPKL